MLRRFENHPVRVLVLDENPLMRQMLEKRARRREGVLLETFEEATELLDRARALAFEIDLVVCARELPDTLAQTLEQHEVPLLLIVDRLSSALGQRDGVSLRERPVSMDEILHSARTNRERAS
jgi:hypothetical protein